MARKPKDLAGCRFGRLVAVERLEISKNAGYYWRCLCDCGDVTKVTIGNLNSGHTISCGCLLREILTEIKTTHGRSKSSEYKSWQKMRERIYNKNCHDYSNYGGAGVIMQTEWDNFEAFISHIGFKPEDGKRYSVDRIDNDIGYVEGNVRWATYEQQARNKTKHNNNTSGVTGVLWDVKVWPSGNDETLYAKAIWNVENGKQSAKSFSEKRFGLLPAFALACKYRDEMIKQLNDQGAGYSDKHGK